MNPVTPNSDFAKQLVDVLLTSIKKGTIEALQFVWNLITSFLFEHWVTVIIILTVIFIYALARALMGSWWILGHVLYNYLYFGSIFAISAIWGPEVFAGTYVDIGLFILYVLCYVLVGKILSRTGLRSYR